MHPLVIVVGKTRLFGGVIGFGIAELTSTAKSVTLGSVRRDRSHPERIEMLLKKLEMFDSWPILN